MAVIKHLPTLLDSNPKIKLLVIDSIAFHFRHDFPDMMARTGLLCRITQELIQQATKHNMAGDPTPRNSCLAPGPGTEPSR
ncbi:hypothetical protein SK128_017756 [Halocaridina rubra]|uniref:Uncharacterized protein n=1 Tax=Halocaridina rubra TaxID=373956 RepID=A0AAN9A531_HALRR